MRSSTNASAHTVAGAANPATVRAADTAAEDVGAAGSSPGRAGSASGGGGGEADTAPLMPDRSVSPGRCASAGCAAWRSAAGRVPGAAAGCGSRLGEVGAGGDGV